MWQRLCADPGYHFNFLSTTERLYGLQKEWVEQRQKQPAVLLETRTQQSRAKQHSMNNQKNQQQRFVTHGSRAAANGKPVCCEQMVLNRRALLV